MSYSAGNVPKAGAAVVSLHNILRAKVASKQPVIGSWLMLPGFNLARLVANQGWDFVLVDCEHGDVDDANMHLQVSAISTAPNCASVVRVAAPEAFLLKRALDTGANAIMTPMMDTAEQARLFVSRCRFPSRRGVQLTNGALPGTRGAGSPFSPTTWKMPLQEYIDRANKEIFLIVQIETQEGLNNCEEIAKVDGVDMLFVGPNDLANSMGFECTKHESIPEVQSAIARVLKAAHDNGKYAGMFCTDPQQVLKRQEQGYDFMNCGFDVVDIASKHGEMIKAIRK